jgi:hypothetical protein
LLAFTDKGKEFMERSSTKMMIKGFFDMQKYAIQAGAKNPAMGATMSIVNARLWNLLGVIDDLTLKTLYVAIAFEEGTDILKDITEIATKVIGFGGMKGDEGDVHFSDEITYIDYNPEGKLTTKEILRLKGDVKP